MFVNSNYQAKLSPTMTENWLVQIFKNNNSSIATTDTPRQGVQIYKGYCKGVDHFTERWMERSGLTHINLGAAATGHRIYLLDGIQVQEGEYFGVRITNREEGYIFTLAGVFIEYQ